MNAVTPVNYDSLVNQIQRSTVLLRLLPFKRCITGAQHNWQARFDGATAQANSLDGGSLVTPANNVRVPAQIALGQYQTASEVTTLMRWMGNNIQSDPNFLRDIMEQGITENIQALAKKLNQDLYIGSGTAPSMTGLQYAASASGSYGGIAQSSYAAWASVVDGYQASPQTFALSMLRTTCADMAVASESRPDIAITSPAVFSSIIGQFEAKATTFNNSADAMNPVPAVRTAAGNVELSGFRAVYWAGENITIVEDPDFQLPYLDGTNPKNHILLMDTSKVFVSYLDPRPALNSLVPAQARALETQKLGAFGALPLEVKYRPNSSTNADIVDISCACSVVVTSRNALGICASVK